MGPPPLSRSMAIATTLLALLLVSKEINGASNGGRSSSGSQQQQTPADFDCPEEFGYYAHPTDCTLYYVCVFGGALLESCTGGLMYSHELQTCDWPRNVGCAPGQQQQISQQPQQQHHTQKVSQQPVSQNVDTPSRGRQRQQQLQIPKADLYTEEEDLGPAEELESDRQQRVYRGQPSTLGQVASDRDGLTHSNAIPVQSSGGRDKLSVVSYGAQQQYNSKNKRRQTDGLKNSDHNFLTNTSRVRKKRDNSNSNRRSTGKKKKRSRRQNKQEGQQAEKVKKKKREETKLNSGKPLNATERSIKTDRSDDNIDRQSESNEGEYDEEEEEENDEEEDGNEEENASSEGSDEEGEDDGDEEEKDEDEKENGSKENSESKESFSDELKFDDSKEKNSSSEDFKIDFPDPPITWESFEDFKFPFDEMDFDFDKFLEDLKSDKFDDFDVFKTEKYPSTTTYPTSIFNYDASTFKPALETSTIPSAVKFDFYFPNFLNNNKKSQDKIDDGDNKNVDENKYSEGRTATSRSDDNSSKDDSSGHVSTIESPLQKSQSTKSDPPENNLERYQFEERAKPERSDQRKQFAGNRMIERNSKNNKFTGNSVPVRNIVKSQYSGNPMLQRNIPHTQTFSPRRVNEAQDRSDSAETLNPRRDQFLNGRTPQSPSRQHRPHHGNSSFINPRRKWNRDQENFAVSGKGQNYNRRGTARFTLNTTPIAAVSTTPNYSKRDKFQQRARDNSLPSYRSQSTEKMADVIQATPKYNTQSTKPSLFDGNHEYRFTYSTHHDSRFEKPQNVRTNKDKSNNEFSTSKPNTLQKSPHNSQESSHEFENISKTNSDPQQPDQRVVSYSYPSVSFRESRGPMPNGNFKHKDGKFDMPQPAHNNPVAVLNNKGTFTHSNQKISGPRNRGQHRQNGPYLSHKRPSSRSYLNQFPFPHNRHEGQPNTYRQPKQKNHPRNFGPRGRNEIKNFSNNHYHNTNSYNNPPSDKYEPPERSPQVINTADDTQDKSRENQKDSPPFSSDSKSSVNPHHTNPSFNQQSMRTPQIEQTFLRTSNPLSIPLENRFKPNSTVYVNNRLHSFSYVNIHDTEDRTSTESGLVDSKPTSGYPNHSPEQTQSFRPSLSDPFQPSVSDSLNPSRSNTLRPSVSDSFQPSLSDSFRPSVSDSFHPSVRDTYQPPVKDSIQYAPPPSNHKPDSKGTFNETETVSNSSTYLHSNDGLRQNPPAGSYVFFTSNIGSTVPVPVHQNNLSETNKDSSGENYNDYYNEYDEGDYEDEGNRTASAPKPPSIPKTLQNIDYQEYEDSDYDEYNDDGREYDSESYDDENESNPSKGSQEDKNSESSKEEYYDDEDGSDDEYEEEEQKPEQSVERPQALDMDNTASSTVTNTQCLPAGVTSQPANASSPCPSELPTDRPTTTTADEQKNSEQTRRTITLLRASVQPVQQQVYDTRGYNTTRYIQQQQYDPNYYAVYDEEAEQYKDIADYAQYVQQNKQDAYSRKKPSVEIVQQEQLQRGSPYSKNKYSNQPENIYQSVTPQEYDSYSIQTNDDIPYRQVQTKTNNRFPEVKESEPIQGERRLFTLPTKYSEGTIQPNTQTDNDKRNGGVRSEPVVTEGNVVNITPRKNDRTAASAEQSASRRSHSPSFAEQINALAPSGGGEDPVAKVLEALSKSEEYLSDEASTERSTESSSTEDSSESGKSSSITVEELDIDFLRNLKSKSSSSEGSLNRFRFTPRSQDNPSTQPTVDLDKYGIGLNQVQATPSPSLATTSEIRNRQAKLIHEEITTPKPLIFRIPEAFGAGGNTFERGRDLSRSRSEGSAREQGRNYNSREDATNFRSRGSQRHNSGEVESNERRSNNYFVTNQGRWQEQQRGQISSNNNDASSSEYRNRGLSRNNEVNRHQSNVNNDPHRNVDQVAPTQLPLTSVPLRITVAPLASNEDNFREQILKQYNARIEENRKQQALENTSSRGSSTANVRTSDTQKTDDSRSDETTEKALPKQVLIRIPVNIQESKPQQRERLMPLSDYVNSNVNTMIDNTGRFPVPDSSAEFVSNEEQASEEARRPVAIRVPESRTKQNEERKQHTSSEHRQSGEDSSRKPIRYIDSLEYHERNSKYESARGSSRFTPSSDELENDELSNMTEEPRRPIRIRLPEKSDSTHYRGRNQKTNSREFYSAEVQQQTDQVSEPVPRPFQQEERRRIVAPSLQRSHDPTTTESVPEVVRSIAIRVPDSIDLNQYRNREESPAARIADSLTPQRGRGRTEEETKQSLDQRGKTRIPFTSREEVRADEQLRNRYEAATTLRPTRVLSLPTTSKPTRPPKKFRNGTLYSDLTLPIGTDMTDPNPSGPDPTIRARPMSYIVPTTPGLTRGNSRHRGSLTYTVAPNEAEAPSQPRGTLPPQRGRPTLKPSTTVVGKAAEFVDIYRYPPRRPDNVYPTPQVDKTAAKCRKDVCLLPDCYCGGKDIPGELTPEETPQIVLLTFDDSVNDLNKGLYSDLFEKGRVNPNGCPIGATFYVSHEWTDYSQVQNLYSAGHEIASHSVSHSFGEQFSQKKWTREIAGQREILAAYGGVRLEDIRGMRAPFLAVGGNKMFKMLYDSNFTYDSSMPVYENRPPSWPYTLDYKIFHDCMIPPCPTKSYPGVWEVPMVMWQDLNGGRCSMGDACSNPPTSDGVYKMLIKNFERHFTTNRAPFGLFYHAAWFTQPHHKEGFIAFLDTINKMPEVWIITNWQAIQWVRDPTPLSRLGNFAPFQCNYPERPKKCNNPKVCNLWHKSGVRYMRTCQACPDVYPWTGKSGVRNSRIDNDLE